MISSTAPDIIDLTANETFKAEVQIGSLKTALKNGESLQTVHQTAESKYTDEYVAGALSRLSGETISASDTEQISALLSKFSQMEHEFFAKYVDKYRESTLEAAAYTALKDRCSAEGTIINFTGMPNPYCYVKDSTVVAGVEHSDNFEVWSPIAQVNASMNRDDCYINSSSNWQYICPESCTTTNGFTMCSLSLIGDLPSSPTDSGYSLASTKLREVLYNHTCHIYGYRGGGRYVIDPSINTLKDNLGNTFYVDSKDNLHLQVLVALVEGAPPPERVSIDPTYNQDNYAKYYTSCKYNSSYRDYCDMFIAEEAQSILEERVKLNNFCI